MAKADSSQGKLLYVLESAYGTTPSGPSMLRLRETDFQIGVQKTALISEERRTDGQIPFVRHGLSRVQGTINGEISYKAWKDWVRAALRYGTTNGSFTSTAGTDTLFEGTGKTFTRTSGSWITDGAVVNMVIRVSGSTSNDGVYTITAVTALVITVSESVTDEAAGQDVAMTGEYAENGTTEDSFSVEAQFTDIGQYELFDGIEVNRMSIGAQVDAFPTISLDVVGQDQSISGSAQDSSPADVDTSDPCDSYTGTLIEGGSAAAIVTAVEINFEWNLATTAVIGSSSIQSVEAGRFNVSGRITAYFEDATLLNKFLNETESSLVVGFKDPAGNEFRVHLPAIKYMGGDHTVRGDDQVMLDMPFQAYRDSTTGLTAYINMIDA